MALRATAATARKLQRATGARLGSANSPAEFALTPETLSEHNEQADLVFLCSKHEHKYPALARLYSIPNGGFRAMKTARIMKLEGAKAGYPDLALDVPRGGYHGLRLEMKRTKDATVRAEQREWHAWLREQGYCVVVTYGCAAAWRVLMWYLALAVTETGPRAAYAHVEK